MTEIAGKKLGVLVSSHPDKGDMGPVSELLAASLKGGVDTYLYLIDDGTRHYLNPVLDELRADGLKVYVCAYGGKPRGVTPDEGAVFGGLAALGGILDACDRFIAFN